MEKFPGKKKLQEEKENVPTLLRSWVDERPEDADEIINQVQNPETKLENTVSEQNTIQNYKLLNTLRDIAQNKGLETIERKYLRELTFHNFILKTSDGVLELTNDGKLKYHELAAGRDLELLTAHIYNINKIESKVLMVRTLNVLNITSLKSIPEISKIYAVNPSQVSIMLKILAYKNNELVTRDESQKIHRYTLSTRGIEFLSQCNVLLQQMNEPLLPKERLDDTIYQFRFPKGAANIEELLDIITHNENIDYEALFPEFNTLSLSFIHKSGLTIRNETKIAGRRPLLNFTISEKGRELLYYLDQRKIIRESLKEVFGINNDQFLDGGISLSVLLTIIEELKIESQTRLQLIEKYHNVTISREISLLISSDPPLIYKTEETGLESDGNNKILALTEYANYTLSPLIIQYYKIEQQLLQFSHEWQDLGLIK